MISKVLETDHDLNFEEIFYKNEVSSNIYDFSKQELGINYNDNLKMLKEINLILQNCANLTVKQKLEYCDSQRYFMKLYLREFNKKLLRRTQI